VSEGGRYLHTIEEVKNWLKELEPAYAGRLEAALQERVFASQVRDERCHDHHHGTDGASGRMMPAAT
jgi:hypothetical protein